jgi:hypothetical protein
MITWDFARELDIAASPGNTTSYFDNMCQSFYIDTGTIRTRVAELEDGHWAEIDREAEVTISDTGYGVLDIEHHYNGHVWGTAQHDADVVLLLYVYMLDVSTWLKSGEQILQADNQIKAGRVTISNADRTVFEDDILTLFAPGNRIRLRFRSGNSDAYDLGQFHIEESPYSETGAEFSFSGRNRLGFHLANQTFDERTSYTGDITGVFTELLTDAGVPTRYQLIESSLDSIALNFNSSDTYMAGLTSALAAADWYMDDKPDGTIVIGTASFVRTNVASTGIHSFDRGSEVFSRAVTRKTDGVYSRVCVQRNGPNPRKVFADVPYYDGWYLAGHRTFYQDVPDDCSDATMDRLSTQLVEGMQYSGIVEKFDSPFRPWLQIGDVAYVTGGDSPRLAGIITEVQHHFGENGYFTSFTVTSGGTISNPDNPLTVASQYVGKLGGANRQRRLLDYLSGNYGSSAGASSSGNIVYQAAVAGGYTGDEQTLNVKVAKVAAGAVVPDGGAKGQLLVKLSATDYDADWIDEGIWGGM